MNKKTLKELKEKLKEERESIEEDLSKFADKDKNLQGDWDTRFPRSKEEVGGSQLEAAADEVEEYEALLPIEHNLENKLQDINIALEKIKKDKYGICEECNKKISIERLKIIPQARKCKKCNK